MIRQARKSIGEPYTCIYDWPEDCFVQCGDNGVVGSVTKGVYTTAFFEAFPKNPSTFIRGEGDCINKAEKNAWEQFNRNISCPKHEYRKHGIDSEHGICIHCGLFTSHVFPPVYSCSVCNKKEVNLEYDDKKYCLEHFIEKMENSNIEDIDPESFSDKDYLRYEKAKAIKFQTLIKYGIFSSSMQEYQDINIWDKRVSNFSIYFQNKIIEQANILGKGLSIFNLIHIKNNIIEDKNLYSKEFLNYIIENGYIKNINVVDFSEDIQKYIEKEKP